MKNSPIYIITFCSILFFACASLQQPQGGPRDQTPPKVLEELPKNLSTNFSANKVEITLDEYFKLSNEFTEISLSPSLETTPVYKVKKKILEIVFKDSLEKNTTYTINFGKAIQDVNESNILKNYSYVFATGPVLDSLQINGTVIGFGDNKPVKDATVFIYHLEQDTLFGKKKPSLFTTTDSAGNFSLKNLKEGKYTIYGLKETSSDRIYNSSNEEIAFLKEPINLTKNTSNVLLKLFKETPERLRILDKKIEKDGRLTYLFNKPIENPSLTFIDPSNIKDPIIEFSSKGDSAFVWLRSYDFDSLKVSINSNRIALDTIKLTRGKKDNYDRTILFGNNLSGGKIKPGNSLQLTFNLPIRDIAKPSIELLEDSVSKSGFTLNRLDQSNRVFSIIYPWKIKKLYTLKFNEGAIKDIYNTTNKPLKLDFELDEIENYGNLSLNIVKEDSLKTYVLQLFNSSKTLYKQEVVKANKTIVLNNIPISKYTLRIIEDENNNGEFDTGNVKQKIQPEKIWLFDKEIITRANWDREEKIIIPKIFPD